jgi:hypothetical protein
MISRDPLSSDGYPILGRACLQTPFRGPQALSLEVAGSQDRPRRRTGALHADRREPPVILAADRRPLLSAMWVFVVFNYLYADLLMMIVNPAIYQSAVAKMSSSAMLGFIVLMEVLIAMVFLSRALPHRANRWANIIAGLLGTAFVAVTLGGSPPFHYMVLSGLEIACTLFIVWYAWTWRVP